LQKRSKDTKKGGGTERSTNQKREEERYPLGERRSRKKTRRAHGEFFGGGPRKGRSHCQTFEDKNITLPRRDNTRERGGRRGTSYCPRKKGSGGNTMKPNRASA